MEGRGERLSGGGAGPCLKEVVSRNTTLSESSWLDEDLLAELGVDLEDTGTDWIRGIVDKKKLSRSSSPGAAAMGIELRKVVSDLGETPVELWMALEKDLNDLEVTWKERFFMAVRQQNPREVYQFECSNRDGRDPPQRLGDELFCCKRQLAGGSFGFVHMARCKTTERKVAIKGLECKHAVWQRMCREVFAGFNVKHPCLVKIHEIFLWNQQVHMVMDLVQSSLPLASKSPDLFSFLTLIRNHQPLRDDETALVAYQVASAMEYLVRRLGAIHRDLKPENILVGPGGLVDIKVADYGAIRLCHEESSLSRALTMGVGSKSYMAGEVNSTSSYGEAADVWSLGCVMYVCGTISLYRKGESLHIPGWGPDLCFLLRRMLDTDPHTRVTADEVLQDPWLLKEVMQHEQLVQKLGLKGLKRDGSQE
eukprot:TRINITY_DN13373_c0_g3_i1.p1 TRINITY_DN13373_c0_g3~~TRINITY_DN13373_c0_g3_i1.p1  ORF type:complete len:423 (-),score=121.33 TRINITY_DN13373_c0_g3_i1:209-1477(-)